MIKTLLLWLFAAGILFPQTALDELVYVKEHIPDIVIDLKYNTLDNFTSQKLYTIDECMLAHGTVQKLKMVQDSLKKITTHNGVNYPQGIGIKIWDGYRPRAVQYLMFEIFPNPVYVADPSTGSIHNRGGAVDLTFIDLATGEELEMPTEFDFFGPEASHTYMNLPPDVIANRALLYNLMVNYAGLIAYTNEWWHYHFQPSSSYPLLDFQMK